MEFKIIYSQVKSDWSLFFISLLLNKLKFQIVKRADDEATLKLDMTKRDFPFDFFFDRSCKEKSGELDSDSESDDE